MSAEIFRRTPSNVNFAFKSPRLQMAGAPTSGDVWLQRIFHYMPAMGPAAAFSFLYILVIGWSSWKTDKARRRDSRRSCCRCQEGFMLILPIVAAVEFLGYSMRVACITNKTLAFYVQQQFFLLVAPIALGELCEIPRRRLDTPRWLAGCVAAWPWPPGRPPPYPRYPPIDSSIVQPF